MAQQDASGCQEQTGGTLAGLRSPGEKERLREKIREGKAPSEARFSVSFVFLSDP